MSSVQATREERVTYLPTSNRIDFQPSKLSVGSLRLISDKALADLPFPVSATMSELVHGVLKFKEWLALIKHV